MKTSKIVVVLALALSFFSIQIADAQRITVQLNPRHRPRHVAYVAPRPVYMAPRPVYVAPRPVYVAPRPVYVAPQPVYVAPRRVYVAPRRAHWRRY